jgi:cytochrome P450
MTDTPTPPAPAPADIPDFPGPRATGCPFDPPPGLRELQAQTPITKVRWRDGTTPWVVTRYAEQRALLADRRLSSDPLNPHFPALTPGYLEVHKQGRAFIRMDDPEHARLRQMVTAWFSVKRVRTLRPAIQQIVDGLIDDMLAGPKPTDLVEVFALAVPSLVICEMLGVPYSDHTFFQQNTKLFNQNDASPQEAVNAGKQLAEYMDGLIADRLANPGNDLMSELAERVQTGELSREDAAQTGVLLLRGGHDTTANMIALATLALLQHPDQLKIVRDTDDPTVIAGAVEELLRYLTIVHLGLPRMAPEDIETAGQIIPEAEGVLVPLNIANRDPAVFPDPDQLDVTRNARAHVAFGFGVHQCLGQNLARVELQIVYGTLYKRIPTLRLATTLNHIQFKDNSLNYGIDELPVTW